jgi:hypothetical protein
MLTRRLYNIDKFALAEHSLKRKFGPDAKRIKNFASLPWRAQPDSLWGHLPHSSVLQETEIEMVFTKEGPLGSGSYSSPSHRINPSHPLCLDCWHSPSQQNKDSSGQRSFLKDHWLKEVSLRQHSKAFLETNQSKSHSGNHPVLRPVKVKDVLSPQVTHQHPFQFGFLRPDALWQIHRRCRSWLQPLQARGPFLPSFALFRISFQRLLARFLEAWGRLHLLRCSRVSKGMPWENSTGHLSYPGTSRFGFFQSQIYRASVSRRHLLCYRSQDDLRNQKQNRHAPLSHLQEGLGSSRVFLSTFPLEETSSFCGHPGAPSRKRLRPAHSLHSKTLCLLGLCDQSSFKSRKVWYFYRPRAAKEVIIRELKESYALAKIPTNNFQGNQFYFHLLVFAYNIINWFKRLCLPPRFQNATLETIRTEFLVLPARLVKTDHRNILKLSAEYISKQALDSIIQNIKKMKPIVI